MEITELFGKTITKVYAAFGMEQGWLDTADCMLELDQKYIIGFPFSFDQDVWIRELPGSAELLFQDSKPTIVIGRKISDFVWYEDDEYGGYFLLDDCSLIAETRMSPNGTGQAGLKFYKNLQELASNKGTGMKKLSDQKLSDR